jgi:hypothetical protein
MDAALRGAAAVRRQSLGLIPNDVVQPLRGIG